MKLLLICLAGCVIQIPAAAMPDLSRGAIEWEVSSNRIVVTSKKQVPVTIGISCATFSKLKLRQIILSVWPNAQSVSAYIEKANEIDRKTCVVITNAGTSSGVGKERILRLPFESSGVCVGQTFGTPLTTHLGLASQAIDFLLKIGEKVVAADDGIVLETAAHFGKGGRDPAFLTKANFVTIVHPDGRVSDYSHLLKGSIKVSPGDVVKKGQILGLSGESGMVEGPHLHFSIARPYVDPKTNQMGQEYMTLPALFESTKSTYRPFLGGFISNQNGVANFENFSDKCRKENFVK